MTTVNGSPKTLSRNDELAAELASYDTPEGRKHLSETNRLLEIMIFGTSIDPNCVISKAIIAAHNANLDIVPQTSRCGSSDYFMKKYGK